MIGHWLISPEGARGLRAARQLGASVAPAQLEQFAARAAAGPGGSPRIMHQVDGVAEIAVVGILTESPDFFSAIFGGGNTTYSDIRSSLRLAAADPNVREVVLSIDSPGGTVQGLFETLGELEVFSKPLRAVSSMACSAAYALAAMCGSIEARTSVSFFGSVGVAAAIFVDPAVVDVTNADSPAKRPDVTTEEGKATVQKELDAIFAEFAGAIARGRETTIEAVTQDFGRGATVLAGEAKAHGMIDSIATSKTRQPAPSSAARESLAELLATRLPEESAEAYVRRCGALLERAALPSVLPGRTAHRETLEQAMARVSAEMPGPFAGDNPAVTPALLAAVAATPARDDAAEPTLEELTTAIENVVAEQRAKPQTPPSRDALAAAVEGQQALDWEGVEA